MSFISPEFVIFFSVVIPLYFLIGHHFRWLLLLVVSYFFYAYGNIQYLPLIAFSTMVDYIAARMLGRTEKPQQRRLWLLSSITVNLVVLFIFKYANFVSGSAVSVLQVLGVDAAVQPLDWVLPIGISFYTFQSMSYTIDVYRGKIEPERRLGVMATYVAFFPQLVAGPIERATNLLPQFSIQQRFDVDRTVSGLQLILWGFFKKVVIADRLAIYVNSVYNNVEDHTGLTLIVATIFFGFQIYCDFSAYSDIAIGTARILGFNLMDNFRQPYFSQSVREFWTRWHISLSTWFRDYVYIPLGGNRTTMRRNLINLMLVFLISGLWHGAGWNFVIWGGLHGLAVAFLAYSRHRDWQMLGGQDVVQRGIRITLTFAFVMLAWVFFRANTIDDAQYILANMWLWDATVDIVAPLSTALLPAMIEWWLIWGLLVLLLAVDAIDSRMGIHVALAKTPLVLRWGIYYAVGASVVMSGIYGTGAQQFIYFQF